jgi:hypothetical protein
LVVGGIGRGRGRHSDLGEVGGHRFSFLFAQRDKRRVFFLN